MSKPYPLLASFLFILNGSMARSQVWDYYWLPTCTGLFNKEYVQKQNVKTCAIRYQYRDSVTVDSENTDAIYEFDKKGNVVKITVNALYSDSVEEVFTFTYDGKGRLMKKQDERYGKPDWNTTRKYFYKNGLLHHTISRYDKTREIESREDFIYDKEKRLIFSKDSFIENYSLFRYDENGYKYEYFLGDVDFPLSQLNAVKTVEDANALSGAFVKYGNDCLIWKDGKMVADGLEKFYYTEQGLVDYTTYGKTQYIQEDITYENGLPTQMIMNQYEQSKMYELYLFRYGYYPTKIPE